MDTETLTNSNTTTPNQQSISNKTFPFSEKYILITQSKIFFFHMY